MAKIYKNLTSTLYLCVRGPLPKTLPPANNRRKVPRQCLTLKTGIMSDLYLVTQQDEDYVDSFFDWD